MTNETHTPGPWRASPPPIMGAYCVTRWPDSDEYSNVAEVERIEDARLIAAAPDLLEALRKVVAASNSDDSGHLHAQIVKARAVIAAYLGGAD